MPQIPVIAPQGTDFTVTQAVAHYIELRQQEGGVRPDTYRHLNKHLTQRLCASIGGKLLRDVTANDLRVWASQITSERTKGPVEPLTVRKHLVDVKTFFKRCLGEGWIHRDPSAVVVLPTTEEQDVNIMPLRDAFEFFKSNRDHRAIGRLALEAFGGLRYTTAAELEKSDLKFDREGIEMPSNKHKSKKRKFRQGQPANCWEWLRHAPDSCWALTRRQYAEEKKEMYLLARMRPLVLKSDQDRDQVKQLRNVWRHSFASYLLAKTKAYQPVAYLMQHARATTTEIYEGIADEIDAHLYFAITPASVLQTWDQFAKAEKAKLSKNGLA